MPEYSENLKQMALEPSRKPVVEFKSPSLGDSLSELINSAREVGTFTGQYVSDTFNSSSNTRLDKHMTGNETIREKLKDRADLTQEQKDRAYSYAGGYDAAINYPNTTAGLKVAAAVYQGADALGSVIGQGLRKLLTGRGMSPKDVIKSDYKDYVDNVAGIEQAQKDLKKGKGKGSDENYQPSPLLMKDAVDRAMKLTK